MTPKVKRDEDTNKLFTDCGVFWAFGQKQFEEGYTKAKKTMAEGEKLVDIGAGGYVPKHNAQKLIDGMKKIGEEFNQAMKDKQEREKYIAYELNNHEAYYTRSIESTLDALGEDFTKEEVMHVFDGRTKITE